LGRCTSVSIEVETGDVNLDEVHEGPKAQDAGAGRALLLLRSTDVGRECRPLRRSIRRLEAQRREVPVHGRASNAAFGRRNARCWQHRRRLPLLQLRTASGQATARAQGVSGQGAEKDGRRALEYSTDPETGIYSGWQPASSALIRTEVAGVAPVGCDRHVQSGAPDADVDGLSGPAVVATAGA
jgi:hypothetical protein